MRDLMFTGEESWLDRLADELAPGYGSVHCAPSLEPCPASFTRDSAPYLTATEFPWLGFPEESLEGRSVMTIAGSGDLPHFFLAMGARRVVAVDISRKACLFCELKRSVLRNLEWEAALRFLLADLAGARGFLTARGLPSIMGTDERSRLYGLARQDLSQSARDHWDRHMNIPRPGRSPFEGFQGLAGLCFLDHIPYLASKEVYNLWRERSAPYPILNLPIQHATSASRARFDILYLSNVLEYWREDHLTRGSHNAFLSQLDRFIHRSWNLLSPGGDLYFYVFRSIKGDGFKAIWKEMSPLLPRGGRMEVHEISYACGSIPGSRFRNTLLRYHKHTSS